MPTDFKEVNPRDVVNQEYSLKLAEIANESGGYCELSERASEPGYYSLRFRVNGVHVASDSRIALADLEHRICVYWDMYRIGRNVEEKANEPGFKAVLADSVALLKVAEAALTLQKKLSRVLGDAALPAEDREILAAEYCKRLGVLLDTATHP